MHNVVDGQKIGGVVELFDECELLFDRAPDMIGNSIREAPGRSFPGNLLQIPLRGLAFGNWLVRIFVFQFVEGEAAAFRDFDRALQRLLIALEKPGHFGGCF